MGSLVFQNIRESKALAYATFGYYGSPSKKDGKYYLLAYVGSQADKFKEAVKAMDELLTSMPTVEKNLNIAKTQLKKEIESERITQDGIIYSYLAAKELGLDYDIRKNIYNNIDNVSMKDLTNFHLRNFSFREKHFNRRTKENRKVQETFVRRIVRLLKIV